MRRASVILATALGATTLAPAARAQQLLLDGELGVGSGLEGGDTDEGMQWRRARTRIVTGLDLRVDETPKDAWGLRALVEIEPHASVGAEARWTRWVSPRFGAFVQATALLAPETLVGGGVGVRFLLPLGEGTSVFLEPQVAAAPLGSDLPDDRVLVWLLGTVGLRANL